MEEEGRDGTVLPDCAKVYLPQLTGRFGMVIDTGFALLPSSLLTIHTDRSRLVSCRSKRPR